MPGLDAGIIVQVAGSKRWLLYDELVPAPRPDQKFKPPAAMLKDPIAEFDLKPGDLLYIPRQGGAEQTPVDTSVRASNG